MKIYLAILLIFGCSLAANGQSDHKIDLPNERRIISFTEPEQMFQLLEGTWMFADMSCAEPYTVTVSADRKSIKFQYFKPQKFKDGTLHDSFTYHVLEVGSYYIRAQIEGESRKTTDGKIVIWDFRYLSPDVFIWHRADWEIAGRTKPVTRCGNGKSLTNRGTRCSRSPMRIESPSRQSRCDWLPPASKVVRGLATSIN